jgi:hypothetical protein
MSAIEKLLESFNSRKYVFCEYLHIVHERRICGGPHKMV